MVGKADNAVGAIQLTHSTRLVFSILPWKGRMLAHVRKFVSGAKYEGPTKSGLTMAGDILVTVVDALEQLKAEVPGPKERKFARVHKGGDVEIVISVVPPDDLKTLPSVDVREYVDSPAYSGPTKKGVRFGWDKLPQFIAILQKQALNLCAEEKTQPTLFPEGRPTWVTAAEHAGETKGPNRDDVLSNLLPRGPKDFPTEFLSGEHPAAEVALPAEPVAVVQGPDGIYAVQSNFGFLHKVRNAAEGNFILYAYLRGHRLVQVPTVMIDVFRAVKAYENYLRDLRHALLLGYERKSGHRPMAEHQTREVFNTLGLPWLD
jgi:hypothetical protein